MFPSYSRLSRSNFLHRLSLWRTYHGSPVLKGKPTDQLVFNMGPPRHQPKNVAKSGAKSPENFQRIINFYKSQMQRNLETLNSVEPKLIEPKDRQISVDETVLNTYTQLPEDSQYIEHHYKHLIHFRNYLSKTSSKKDNSGSAVEANSSSTISEKSGGTKDVKFADFDSVHLLQHLQDFISSRLLPENIQKDESGEYLIELEDGDKVNLSEFVKLLLDVKVTLNLNCNHTFILDTLLYNKETFDIIDKKIQQESRKRQKE